MIRRSRRWPVLLVALLLLVVEWMGVSALVSRSLLKEAQGGVDHARALVRSGDVSGALAEGRAVQHRTSAARWLTSGPLWSAADVVPGVSAVRQLISAVDDISHKALPPLTDAAGLLKGGRLKRPDGSIDLAALTRAGADVHEAQAQLAALKGRVAGLDAGVASAARDQLLSAVAKLQRDLQSADRATKIGPAMLGGDGPRHYLLLFENTAELRGTGGLIGSWAEVEADDGHLTMTRSGSDNDLVNAAHAFSISPEFDARWGRSSFHAGSDWREVNDSPHFPWVAQAVSDLWRTQTGETVDGVIGVDTQAAAALVAATGPLTLSNGKRLQGSDFTHYLQTDVYVDYPTFHETDARLKVLSDLQQQLFGRIRGGGDAGALVGALAGAEGAGHIKIWSAHPDEQAVLDQTLLAGALPSRPGPFAGIVLNNNGANKVDAFLHVDVRWTAKDCQDTLTLTVRNAITKTYLLPYLAGTGGVVAPDIPLGRNAFYLSVYADVGATIDPQVSIDGQSTSALTATERDHPVVGFYDHLDPGETHTIVVRWRSTAAGPVQPLWLQPFVVAPTTHVDVASCS